MKIDTTTILLIAAAGAVVYFVTRPAPVKAVSPSLPYYNPAANQPPPNYTAQDITAGAAGAASILDIISNWNK